MDEFNTKEVYEASLKTTSNLEIGGRTFVAGETILSFDNLQLSVLNEQKNNTQAQGGYLNPIQIRWEETQSVTFVCEKGVMSKLSMAMLTNSKLYEGLANVLAPKTETIESDATGKIILKYIPLTTEFFIYNTTTGISITGYTLNSKTLTNLTAFTTYTIRYLFRYTGVASVLNIGQRLFNGTLKFTAKMRLKDDSTGLNTTGILEIPSVRLVSDLSMRLGTDIIPNVSTFRLLGEPVGERNTGKYVCQFTYLATDIDTDFLL